MKNLPIKLVRCFIYLFVPSPDSVAAILDRHLGGPLYLLKTGCCTSALLFESARRSHTPLPVRKEHISDVEWV
jgi:hypothetical protein